MVYFKTTPTELSLPKFLNEILRESKYSWIALEFITQIQAMTIKIKFWRFGDLNTATNELIELSNKIKGVASHPYIKNTNELIKRPPCVRTKRIDKSINKNKSLCTKQKLRGKTHPFPFASSTESPMLRPQFRDRSRK
jgi:hypothetical protein